ncbi:DNA polymerase [Clostridium sporogenes]|uniref:DNA polymerase n=1 Tax=Clostridium sporogenes TaxID=1509 RepID=UPI00024BA02C|nr:DNA polymerase [Clostridium sporogenes]EHN13416.1 DNA-directed DNA polymerase [Clostridium sporogenes PA 3679]MDU4598319.1 DNA polymerase [Clostridium sporogenes]NFQ33535.1 hypothetical protein [Clostridium sporogenes]NFQ61179.1 hypothetical protein [Clostridium sporogenes]NFU09098.1 hypothetical protein [Clostridium sporogenes]
MLAIDIETYSSVDLLKCGVYAYTEAEDFTILLFAYAYDDKPIKIIDLACGEKLPQSIIDDLTDPNVMKTAFNANFERTCLAKYLSRLMPPDQWRCSAVHALTLGLPTSLEKVAKCMNLEQQKMNEGKALIRYFSMPCKSTKANGGRTRNLPEHDREKWNTFKIYCRQDVEVERAIRKKLEKFPMTEKELELWFLDQKINDGGVKVNKTLVKNAIQFDDTYQKELMDEAIKITNLENPNSTSQLKKWLADEGIEVESLSKANVAELLAKVSNCKIKKVLKLRQELSKTSVKKYEAMERAVCKDERIRGLLQFYGANRTGRWAGRLVQIHNLPRNGLKDLDLARKLLIQGEYETLELLFDSVPDVLSQLIRTAFIPTENSRFIVSDFSAIEARIIAWLAGEKWRIDVFSTHGKIYEASASQMFGVPIEDITKGSVLRQKGKIAELALGYGGSKGALKSMGALNMGLTEEELPELVSAWRKSNSKIVKLWYEIENAAIRVVKEKMEVNMQYGLKFYYKDRILFVRLPSGRSLAYVRPRIEIDERFNKDKLTYEGVEQGTKSWGRISTFGGKLTENIIQAIARDCLGEAMLRLNKAGYKIRFHIHDEVILDVSIGAGSLDEVNEIMGESIDWAPGLLLKAEGFETDYYKKD